jgi:hypothetical protein
MGARRSCTVPSRNAIHDVTVDVVAIALGIAAFAILLGLILAIDRI